ncbi:recombination protein NinG [Tenacibaculum caenipelagi]|uniref:NinG protein n=1 Tax=Tenacibaculum caenipelagi TaxID=1325435 RepID=A0A4R6TDW2_9FLAO|nr:recombination protein NinG [Tenacibaculum caenipelagi]TDQ27678.1 NinG protein [Tenacibaculum caenipelagi]
MIEPKPKPCKGTGQAKGYGCGKITKYRVYGLGKMCCYANWLLTSENGKIKLAKAELKATKERRELEAVKEEKKQRNGLASLLKSVRDVCHKYIRLRDIGKPCISCGEPYHKDHQAGHFYKAELFSSIKFNEDNIHGQCVQCNIRRKGNESEYRVRLPNRIGKERFENLNEIAALDKQINHKWDREELKRIRNYYNQKLKEL